MNYLKSVQINDGVFRLRKIIKEMNRYDSFKELFGELQADQIMDSLWFEYYHIKNDITKRLMTPLERKSE
jgi:cell fate (sporulation/competence/biofilm development) regulator YlbF (YheA/YmcA/DUF963 family)